MRLDIKEGIVEERKMTVTDKDSAYSFGSVYGHHQFVQKKETEKWYDYPLFVPPVVVWVDTCSQVLSSRILRCFDQAALSVIGRQIRAERYRF